MRQVNCISRLLGPAQFESTWRCVNRCGSSAVRKQMVFLAGNTHPETAESRYKSSSPLPTLWSSETNSLFLLFVVVFGTNETGNRSLLLRICIETCQPTCEDDGRVRDAPDGCARRVTMTDGALSQSLTLLRFRNILHLPTCRVSTCTTDPVYLPLQGYALPETSFLRVVLFTQQEHCF